ncbi:hypothetical protein L228DRAFT_92352 [Xylona heveae TC161]|uniref:Arrestin-like N-terminal domain-containing protein n=1 Tax=Xylona heveae (strain CBS 132557 / TC161) TaxID=1328760 RepID=A0A161TE92_XYLHT|nr:hypothetical protein L228DRAFT_92352 [Xylona heveae TC161]KZF24247.1 hypothetical protein L228DRAFT_92352 [Xylona heveae TC161]
MAVRIQLDRPYNHFTNLDYISGRVTLNLTSDTSISAVVVKLEGESRTRLAGPRTPYSDRPDRKKTELEIHKLLYKTQTVFPSKEIQSHTSGNSSFTLGPGTHEYAFQFKIPFNNDCLTSNSLHIAGLRLDMISDPNMHVKRTLPPSLSGFPGEAEIKYYVKVTVVRPQFYKENFRDFSDFKFFPIEPPRQPATKEERYARRQHNFTAGLAPYPKKKGLFEALKARNSSAASLTAPRVSVDVRLPNPPILTCNEPLPIRVIVQKQNESPEVIFLQMLQIELIGYTDIRAHDLRRTEVGSWVIRSVSNLAKPLGSPTDPAGKDIVVDSSLWDRLPLPNTVAPSFQTCNIARHYELEVRLGLSYGTPGNIKPELIVLPLRHQVEVFSGIAPPEALIAAMRAGAGSLAAAATAATAKPSLQQPPMPPNSLPPGGPSVPPAAGPGLAPIYPGGPPMPESPVTPSYSQFPPQAGDAGTAIHPPVPDVAPPSYEDAMADEIGPVDGPRRDYNPPPSPPGGGIGNGDRKSRLST